MLRAPGAGLLLCVLLAGLCGCGQKGPLYLPVTPPRTIPAMPQAATHATPAPAARSAGTAARSR